MQHHLFQEYIEIRTYHASDPPQYCNAKLAICFEIVLVTFHSDTVCHVCLHVLYVSNSGRNLKQKCLEMSTTLQQWKNS